MSYLFSATNPSNSPASRSRMAAAVVNWASIRWEGAPKDSRALASVRMKSFFMLFAAKPWISLSGWASRITSLTYIMLNGLNFSTRLRAPKRDSCKIAEFLGKLACKRECAGGRSNEGPGSGRWEDLLATILRFTMVLCLKVSAHGVRRRSSEEEDVRFRFVLSYINVLLSVSRLSSKPD